MSVSYVKFCPQCKSSTALDTAICAHCGHQFRSHLVAPVSEKTISMQSPIAPSASGLTSSQPAPSARPLLPRIPRPLLILCLAALALLIGTGSAVRYAIRTHNEAQHRTEAALLSAGPPYDVVFQSTPSQRMAPVATQTDKDLTQWLRLQTLSSTPDHSGNDYPETVRLYMTHRILLITAGTRGRVLEERGAYRQVKILDGLNEGSTGFVPQESVRRLGQSAPPPGQVLTIP